MTILAAVLLLVAVAALVTIKVAAGRKVKQLAREGACVTASDVDAVGADADLERTVDTAFPETVRVLEPIVIARDLRPIEGAPIEGERYFFLSQSRHGREVSGLCEKTIRGGYWVKIVVRPAGVWRGPWVEYVPVSMLRKAA